MPCRAFPPNRARSGPRQGTTVSAAAPMTVGSLTAVAMTLADPPFVARRKPVMESTVAIDALLTLQRHEVDSVAQPFATNRVVSPTCSVIVAGDTVIVVTQTTTVPLDVVGLSFAEHAAAAPTAATATRSGSLIFIFMIISSPRYTNQPKSTCTPCSTIRARRPSAAARIVPEMSIATSRTARVHSRPTA
jgi:hypothetical protein